MNVFKDAINRAGAIVLVVCDWRRTSTMRRLMVYALRLAPPFIGRSISQKIIRVCSSFIFRLMNVGFVEDRRRRRANYGAVDQLQ